MPVYPNLRTVFVHIPKTGGSTVTTLLKRDHLLSRRVNERHPQDEERATISGLLKLVGDEADDYYKFAFVRNPWDRFVSAYHYVCQRRPDLTEVSDCGSFDEFMATFARDPDRFLKIRYFIPQSYFLTARSGEMPIDFIGRFERFDDDLKVVMKQLGLRRSTVRHRKKTARSDYRDYFDDDSRDVVAQAYARDIELFGYSFEDGSTRKKSKFLGLF